MTPEERNQLVEDNLGLAPFFAKKYRASRMEFDDLVQEAYLGLMDAAEKYDPRKGKFSTYARWHIQKRIMEAIHNRNDIIRTPRRRKATACGHLDDMIAESVLVDQDPQPYEALDEREKMHALGRCIKDLPDREGIVIRLRYGVNNPRMTLAQVGAILGVTAERVRQIQRKAEKKLRVLILQCATLKDHGAVTAGRRKEPAQPNPEN